MTLATLAIGMAVAFPLGVLASHQFDDVPTGNPFHTDIDALVDSGVTSGCGGGKYCPTDYVTREQMAAFLNRLGALQEGRTPVVNAARVDGIDQVMPGGEIELRQIGPWLPAAGEGVTVSPSFGGASFIRNEAGPGQAVLPLHYPGTIGGVTYGIVQVQVCFAGASVVSIDATKVLRTNGTSSVQPLIVDPTDRQAGSETCYAAVPESLFSPEGAPALVLDLVFDDIGSIVIGEIRTTWGPVI